MHPSKRIFMIFGGKVSSLPQLENIRPVGTGFSVNRPELVLTADHVVQGYTWVLVVNTFGPEFQIYEVPRSRIVSHSRADVAAILLPVGEWHDIECFELGVPPPGYSDFPLGEEIISYGYPQMGNEKPIPHRLLKGHLQMEFTCREQHYKYSAFELSFPAFPGLSGSPIILNRYRENVMGIVTKSTSFKSESQGEVMAEASWAIGASLTPISDWIDELTNRISTSL